MVLFFCRSVKDNKKKFDLKENTQDRIQKAEVGLRILDFDFHFTVLVFADQNDYQPRQHSLYRNPFESNLLKVKKNRYNYVF